ncbi:MAG: recombinase family protein [Phycisphaerales bacterium]|jgi:DNA invertase Pin-like site-specific DNA recombinase
MSTKAYLYARVSGRSQIDGDGIPRQRVAVQAWAANANVEIAGEYVEGGVSGADDCMERPAFQDMLSAILGNGVKAIVVENLSRLARSFVVQDSILTYLASRGISLYSADTGACVTDDIQQDAMKRAIVQMQAVMFELEKSMLVRKLRAARQRKRAATGRCEGTIPFGHKPGEEATLARIRELANRGAGAVRIAKALNATGHRTRKGGDWKAGTVQGILARI